MSNYWGVTLDLTDHTTDNNSGIGLNAGVFYWITGRPGYAGSGYSGEAPASKTWYEDIIAIDGLSDMVRMTKNLEVSGGYGGLSGFSLKIDNTGGLNNTLETNDYWVSNRPIDVYCFIDNVSYHCWGGVVDTANVKGLVLTLKCVDDFKNIHKPLPKSVMNKKTYPNISSDIEGEPIPIVIGDVLRSKILSVTSEPEYVTMAKISPDMKEVNVVSAIGSAFVGNTYYLLLKIPYMDFPSGFFTGYSLRVLKGDEQTIGITGSDAATNPNTVNATVGIYLEHKFKDVTESEFDSQYAYGAGPLLDEMWVFQIIKLTTNYIISENAISECPLDDSNKYTISTWNKDTKDYDDIGELGSSVDTTTSNVVNHPNVVMVNNNLKISGEITRLVGIIPEDFEFLGYTGTLGPLGFETLSNTATNYVLFNRDRRDVKHWSATVTSPTVVLKFRVKFPSNTVIKGLDELYLMVDFDCEVPIGSQAVNITWVIKNYGPYNLLFYTTPSGGTHPTSLTCYPNANVNYLPNSYYNGGGYDNSETTYFGQEISSEDINDKWLLSSNIIDSFNDASGSRWIYCELQFTHPSADIQPHIRIKQIGFVGNKDLNTVKDDIFIKTKGETV